MDFIAYNKLSSLNKTGTYQTIQIAAILEIVTIVCGNIISMVFGIITLTNLNKEHVKAFLREKGVF